MLKYKRYPVGDELLLCCDSFVLQRSALIPQVPSCFKRTTLLKKTHRQELNPNVICLHMQALLIDRTHIAETKERSNPPIWRRWLGKEWNESRRCCAVVKITWIHGNAGVKTWGHERDNRKCGCKCSNVAKVDARSNFKWHLSYMDSLLVPMGWWNKGIQDIYWNC